MKKIILVTLLVAFASASCFADYYKTTVSNCDDAQMRAALDDAAAENRAVITVVECEYSDETETTQTVTQTHSYDRDDSYADSYRNYAQNVYVYQPQPIEAVVQREYFVRETVQQYKPVIKYVPSGTYTRVKRTCNRGC